MNFIAFGCWNRGLCSDISTNGMSLILNDIKNKESQYTNHTIFVLGDNYYPEKKTSSGKIFDEDAFMSGFNCLSQINLKKDVILGNHEINDIFNVDSSLIKCQSVNRIIDNFIDDPLYTIFNDVSAILEDNTLILKIDTTIYTDYEDIEFECYNRLFLDVERIGDKEIDINNIRKHQYDKMVEYIIKYFNHFDRLIIFGHHPLCFARLKSGSLNLRTGFSKLINDIIRISSIINLSEKQIYYICADVHFYEKSTIEFNNILINQYIVGPGGAKFDNPISNIFYDGITIKVDNSQCNIISDYTYKIYDQKREYGYLTFKDNNFNFIPVSPPENHHIRKYMIKYE